MVNINTAMKIVFTVFTLLLIGQASEQDFLENDSYAHIVYLSRDIGSRVTGSTNNELAGEYISQKFIEYGLDVKIQEFEFNSRFSDDGKEASNGRIIKGRNIIGTLEGKSNKKIIIGAHYDTVPGSPGANDNAAGVAILMEIAKALSYENFYHTIVFVAFDAEEQYFRGSSYYLQNVENPETIDFMIDIDSVSRGNVLVPMAWNYEPSGRSFFQSGYLQSPLWLIGTICDEADIEGLNCLYPAKDQLRLVIFGEISNPIYSLGDSGIFFEKGIPSVGLVTYKIPDSHSMNFNGTPNFYAEYIPDIHTKEDTYDKIDIQNLKKMKKIIISSIRQLDNKHKDVTISDTYSGGLLASFNKKLFKVPWFVVFLSFTLIPIAISIAIFTGLKHHFISIVPTFLSLLLLVIIKDSEPFSAVTTGIKTNFIIFIIFLTLFFIMLKRKENKKLLFKCAIILYLIGSLMFFNFDTPRNTPAAIIYIVLSVYVISHVIFVLYFTKPVDNFQSVK